MSLRPSHPYSPALPRWVAACASVCLCGCAPVLAADATGTMAVTSDYVFRGISQTHGDPALQAGARLTAASGAYGAIWGSTVEFPGDSGASAELDYVVGWSGSLAPGWALDVNATWFDYPGSRAALDYPELVGTLTRRERYWLTLGWSPDAFASDGTGVYTQLGARLPLGEAVRLEAAVGRYDLDDAYGDSYTHGQLSAVWALRAPFELRVTAHTTDSSARTLFPGLAGARMEAALQAAF